MPLVNRICSEVFINQSPKYLDSLAAVRGAARYAQLIPESEWSSH